MGVADAVDVGAAGVDWTLFVVAGADEAGWTSTGVFLVEPVRVVGPLNVVGLTLARSAEFTSSITPDSVRVDGVPLFAAGAEDAAALSAGTMLPVVFGSADWDSLAFVDGDALAAPGADADACRLCLRAPPCGRLLYEFEPATYVSKMISLVTSIW